MAEFTDLVGTAIANAQARADLVASRARIVTTADEARRRIERNLHDGAQQQLVALGLHARMAQESAPAELVELQTELSELVSGLIVSPRSCSRSPAEFTRRSCPKVDLARR